jgi:RND family efflux transporter MFP subunit
MKSRLLILLVLLAVVSSVGGLTVYRARAAEQRVPPAVIRPGVVRCETLRERTYTMTESFHGLISAKARVDMAFQIPGRISQLGETKDCPIRENDRVEQGQVLAMLEPLRFQAAVEQAQAAMEQAKAAVASAQAKIAEAQAHLDDAKHELGRVQALKDKGAANPRECERAETDYKLMLAQCDGAKAELASASAQYESGRAAATVASVNLQDATLRAPMRALVARVPVELGQLVQPSQAVVTLVDLSRVKLIVGVVERKLPLVKKGQKVRIEIDALMAQANVDRTAGDLGKPRSGLITLVPPAADPTTGLFNVEIEMDNADGVLRPGMVGKAIVDLMERRAIAIPAEATARAGEDYYAYFVGEGYAAGLDVGALGRARIDVPTNVARKVTFRPVAVDKDCYLVTDAPAGLKQLIVEGQSRLTDGQPITIVGDKQSAAAD